MRALLTSAIIILNTLVVGCKSEPTCHPPNKQYRVFLYRTPHESFLFRKEVGKQPIGFSVRGNGLFDREIEHVFTSHIGRDIGVEALVCGSIKDVDLPLTVFNKSMDIQSGKIIAQVDMTQMIKAYDASIGMPDFSDTPELQ